MPLHAEMAQNRPTFSLRRRNVGVPALAWDGGFPSLIAPEPDRPKDRTICSVAEPRP